MKGVAMALSATGNEVNDAIIRLFLYGQESGLRDYLSDSIIRPDSAFTSYPTLTVSNKVRRLAASIQRPSVAG
jgi:hypothetical protein